VNPHSQRQLFCLSSSGIIGGRHEYERTGISG
jgi:hypothetical protein